MTSEFSECVPIVGPDEAASADVGPDETGPVFDDLDATVARTSTSRATGGPTAQRGGGGTLFVTRYATRPERNVFADATASAPNGTQVRPETVAERNWRIADRGLTPAGGAPEATPTFEVCFGAEGAVFPAHQDAVVVVQRSVATGGLWEPLATTREAHGGAPYLCAAGVTVLGEFGLGGSEAAFPVDAEGVAPGVPRSLALGRARPNPFSGTTTLDLALPSVAMVAAEVFDALGRRVAVLHDGPLAAGVHALAFDARSLPTGVYLVRAVTEAGAVAQRVTVVR